MNLFEKLEELKKNLTIKINRIHDYKAKYSLRALGIDINNYESTNDGLEQLQLKYGIKMNDNGFISWNEEYKNEVLNDFYLQVLDDNIQNIQLLIPELRIQYETKNQKELNKYLHKKLNGLNKSINSHEGYLFFDEDYRNTKNNLLKNRFDVIWKINEMYLIFPLSKRKEDTLIIASAEYPFVFFNIQQWCEFELSFHLIPLFKETIIQNPESTLKPSEADKILDLRVPILHDPIFLKNMIWVFYEVLLECYAIDEENKPISGKFRPICDAIFTEGKDLLFKYNIDKKEYIAYLNNKNGFNDSFSKLSNGVIHQQEVNKKIKNSIKKLRELLPEN